MLLRALTQVGLLTAPAGQVAVGWLIVEDILTVLALVMLPALAPSITGSGGEALAAGEVAGVIGVTLLKVAGFAALMLVVGVRVVPWVLRQVEQTGSRELFILAVLATALGFAYGAAVIFDVSFALGAFLAGIVVNESELSHRAAEEALPLREAFAVLFFVSVGMLIDPAVFLNEPLRVLGVIAIVMLGKALAALLIVWLRRGPLATGLVVAAGLSQIGEFSFILAELATSLDLIPAEARDLLLAGALVSITLNPLLFGALGPVHGWLSERLPAGVLRERSVA